MWQLPLKTVVVQEVERPTVRRLTVVKLQVEATTTVAAATTPIRRSRSLSRGEILENEEGVPVWTPLYLYTFSPY